MASDKKLTARDFEILAASLQSLKDPASFSAAFSVNYDKLAELAGLTVGSAKTMFGTVKKKLLAGATLDVTATTPSKKKVAKGSSDEAATKAAVTTEDSAVQGEQSPKTPSPKKKGGRKPKAETEQATQESYTVGGFTPINTDGNNPENAATPAKKRGRKPKDPNATPAKRQKKTAQKGTDTGVVDDDNGNVPTDAPLALSDIPYHDEGADEEILRFSSEQQMLDELNDA